jgi:hypothetical protein
MSTMKTFRCAALLAVFIMIAATGCKKTAGGGWIQVPGGKATLGFQASCENIGYPVGQIPPDLYVAHVTGQFQYKDHRENVAFNAVVDFIPYEIDPNLPPSCEEIDELLEGEGLGTTFLMLGTYIPIPTNAGDGGEVAVIVADGGDIGCGDDGDLVVVQLSGGVHDGYTAEGCLERGNITVFTE